MKEINALSEIAGILREMGPDMAQLAGRELTYEDICWRKLDHAEKVKTTFKKAASLNRCIRQLMLESTDNCSHLAEAKDIVSNAIIDLHTYLADYKKGLESEATHEAGCTCQKCSDERYPSGTYL